MNLPSLGNMIDKCLQLADESGAKKEDINPFIRVYIGIINRCALQFLPKTQIDSPAGLKYDLALDEQLLLGIYRLLDINMISDIVGIHFVDQLTSEEKKMYQNILVLYHTGDNQKLNQYLCKKLEKVLPNTSLLIALINNINAGMGLDDAMLCVLADHGRCISYLEYPGLSAELIKYITEFRFYILDTIAKGRKSFAVGCTHKTIQ